MESLTPEEVRTALSPLKDPHTGGDSAAEDLLIKEEAVRFITILAYLFGRDLDRVTLWDRIGSAPSTALARTRGNDLEQFAAICLEHVKAKDADVAGCSALHQLLAGWETRPASYRARFLLWVRDHRATLLARGKARWEEVKAGRIEL